jgi:hypothetical protein
VGRGTDALIETAMLRLLCEFDSGAAALPKAESSGAADSTKTSPEGRRVSLETTQRSQAKIIPK